MAKMFYSLEEAAQKLSKSQDELRGMVSSGQLQEFRNNDKLMFKREQVDLLAGGTKGGSGTFIPLADNASSGIGLSLEDSTTGKGGSGGGIALDEPDSKQRSGISIFDADTAEEGDPLAATRITETRFGGSLGGNDELTLESVGSGSGLLDLTREADDTSLGADLMEDVYRANDGSAAGLPSGSGLFEATNAPSDVSGAMNAGAGFAGASMIAAEPYDGSASGWAGGLALGVIVVCLVSLAGVLMGLMTGGGSTLQIFSSNLMIWLGVFAVVMLLSAGIGWMLGKKTA